MKTKSENAIPNGKLKSVAELRELIKKYKTILIASVKSLPASQFQEIGKKLRGKAIVKVPKKNLIFRAIDESGNDTLKNLKDRIDDSVALLFSNLDSFDLALELLKNKTSTKAKPGQEAPEDIEVKAGMTELTPGPAISELGALGLTTKVTQGKLEITNNRVIVQKGKKISQGAADIMTKLGIKPFSIGFIPVCAFDIKEGKLYSEINIDREGTIAKLKEAYSRALPFAVEIGYPSEDTIKFLLQKAGRHANKINRIMTGEPEPEVVVAVAEAPKEETKHKEEEKAPAAEGLSALFG